MRPYRGMRVDNGEWAKGWYGESEGKSYIADWDKGFKYDFGDGTEGTHWHIEVIPETVGQYTGLKDKNGIEIYKNSRIRVTWDDGEIEEYTVIQSGWGFCCDNFAYLPETDQIEVIGHIHEDK